MLSTAAFYARDRGSVPGLGGLKETKMFLPHPRVKVSIVGSLRDREVACSASDRHTWMGKKQFCFFQTAETWNRTPDSGVKGSGANHYPRAPALLIVVTACIDLKINAVTTRCGRVGVTPAAGVINSHTLQS